VVNTALAQSVVKPVGERSSERWSTREKFTIVVETASLSEIKLSIGILPRQRAVCRAGGRMAQCLFAGEQDAKELRAKDQQLCDLSWELKRKEAALTETADLLVLRKKGPSDLGMWYNTEHRYSGLNFLTLSQRHDGLVEQIFDRRKQVYETAKAAHPARWSGDTRDWSLEEEVWLNPEKATAIQAEQNA
jgi:hypothetical protein